MIIGFGFGNPLTSILMLLATSLISYFLFRLLRRNHPEQKPTRAQLRQYYYEQRRQAREYAAQYDLTDEEIERKLDEQLGKELN
ncbi:hypothetical protein LSG31_14380 [Fodinisporobacter ferrooxydans]|uniref:SHOCT domain-containing protein n=1 Tax=Fodinisporobacter ferrooxydans TaxID=2901836 RepID=A0ABY4CF05_9BACL|nr:hypothetical protein LSG31_14380 [Alicyclobacillaceae bacterium MYW30-H2]